MRGQMATQTPAALDRDRIAELTEREQQRLDERTPASRDDLRARAPDPLWWRCVLVSGCEIRGRSTSRTESARASGTSTGTRWSTSTTASARWCRATPPRDRPRRPGSGRARYALRSATEDGIVVAEELARRFGLPKWRYVNSGSEATMDAIRIARAYTGRDTVVKIFGSYHGHHDAVMVSIGVPYARSATARSTPRSATARGSPRRSQS